MEKYMLFMGNNWTSIMATTGLGDVEAVELAQIE